MAYIGAVVPGYDPTRASVPQLDAERFNGDASTTTFTLTRQVASPTDINVIVENVLQEPTVAYSVNGYTLTFTEAPGTGTNNIYVIYRASAVSNFAYVPDGSITYAKLANNIRQFTVDTFTANGTGSTIALTETPASANSLIVSVDGVIQTAPTNYTLSGSTITFTGVPDNGANVVVKHIGFRTTSTVTALQASSVTATEIADGSVTNAKIVSVANTKITGNITATNLAGGSNGTIPYQSANGTTQMLAVGTSGQLLQTNGAGAPSWATVSTSPVPTMNVLTSGTSWTAPTGVTKIRVYVTGGGGGGSYGKSLEAGPGGSAGGTAIKVFTVVAGNSYTYAIGAGGDGGIGSSLTLATNGGQSTFTVGATTVTGNGGTAAGNGGNGTLKSGGSASSGDINITGGGSSAGGVASAASYQFAGGSSGASYYGGGGGSASLVSPNSGGAGQAYGSGGGGGAGNSTDGGAGKAGVIVVEY